MGNASVWGLIDKTKVDIIQGRPWGWRGNTPETEDFGFVKNGFIFQTASNYRFLIKALKNSKNQILIEIFIYKTKGFSQKFQLQIDI